MIGGGFEVKGCIVRHAWIPGAPYHVGECIYKDEKTTSHRESPTRSPLHRAQYLGMAPTSKRFILYFAYSGSLTACCSLAACRSLTTCGSLDARRSPESPS